MRIDAQTYRDAAVEHSTLAVDLYEAGRYVFAIYTAGVAAECVLRSFISGPAEPVQSGHDLRRLAKESRFLQHVPTQHAEEAGAALGHLWARWHNLLRYCSSASLKRMLLERNLHVGVRGDVSKEAARVAVNSALTIVNRGRLAWTR